MRIHIRLLPAMKKRESERFSGPEGDVKEITISGLVPEFLIRFHEALRNRIAFVHYLCVTSPHQLRSFYRDV